MASIKDVAREAGVSVSTVSHVLNKTRYVAPATTNRVEEAVASLGYKPSSLARALKTNRTQTLGMLVSNSTNPFFADVVRGVEESCYDNGYSLILCNSNDNAERQLAYLDTLTAKSVDALVVMTTHGDPEFDHQLSQQPDLPMVVLDAESSENVCVMGDNSVLGGRLATEHLLQCGFTRIGLLSGPQNHPRVKERRAGFTQAMRAASNTIDENYCVYEQLTAGGGYRAMNELLQRFSREGLPEAVFAFNDLMALGAMRALSEQGISVPEGMSIIGYDDIDLAAYFNPPLTTIHQPGFELGTRAALTLIERLRNGASMPANLTLNPELVIRGSVMERIS